jgi:hypothetical protein
MIISYLNIGIGAVAGGVLAFGLLSAYNGLIENPGIRAETRQIVEAEAQQRTYDAINQVNDTAERARAMRRFCADRGLLYNFTTGKCREE